MRRRPFPCAASRRTRTRQTAWQNGRKCAAWKRLYKCTPNCYTLTMQNLIFVNGTMGVGKSAVCRELKKILPQNVFLDGDNCWDMTPFTVNETTCRMVLGNICALINGFLQSGEFENILFCWVMHERGIVDEILSRLSGEFRFSLFTLQCSEQELLRRLSGDIAAGLRSQDVVSRSLERAAHYKDMRSVCIDTTNLTPLQTAHKILSLIKNT